MVGDPLALDRQLGPPQWKLYGQSKVENIGPVRNTRENVHLINVVARQTQCTHTVAHAILTPFVRVSGARARTGVHIHGRFAALCIQTVEFTAKLVHLVAQLNYPSDSGKVVSAISGNVARERFDEVRHRNSCSRYPGKTSPLLRHPTSLFIHPQSLASLPVTGRRNIAGLREKGVDVREPAIPGWISTIYNRRNRNPAEHAASFYINPPPSSNDIHCWTALMVRLVGGIIEIVRGSVNSSDHCGENILRGFSGGLFLLCFRLIELRWFESKFILIN